MAWSIHTRTGFQSDQISYVGGKPRLPEGREVPICQLCGSGQTFFFQIALPDGALWDGFTVAAYQCTRCVDKNHLIPEMLEELGSAIIPAGFLDRYQRNFTFVVFPTHQGLIVHSYKEAVLFSELQLIAGDSQGSFGKLGGTPDWILEDESPSTYGDGIPMAFLMELVPGFQFKITTGADPQVELDLMSRPAPSPLDFYQLFIGNALYLFGTTRGDRKIYAITQV